MCLRRSKWTSQRTENAGTNDEVEMPVAPNNDNVNRNLQQLPWGLDLAHLVLREPGLPATEINYPGSYCICESAHHVPMQLSMVQDTKVVLTPLQGYLGILDRCCLITCAVSTKCCAALQLTGQVRCTQFASTGSQRSGLWTTRPAQVSRLAATCGHASAMLIPKS